MQCNEGYDMEGDMIILCLEDGTTQPPPQGHPTCTEAKAPCMVPFVGKQCPWTGKTEPCGVRGRASRSFNKRVAHRTVYAFELTKVDFETS